MHLETLPKRVAKVLAKLQSRKFLQPFYLSGGTALSLQLGHRESEDLDFFNQTSFDPLVLQQELEKLGSLTEVQLDKDTLNLYLSGVRLQFLRYPYRLLKPLLNWQGINLASVLDIACTKLQTIAARGNKKDFVDLYLILKQNSLERLFSAMKKKYPQVDYNQTHILKSLVYFKDAEKQPMPRLRVRVGWKEIKKEITNQVKSFEF